MDTTPNGPMTRSRVKALHEKVTSLLSMCDLDLPLNCLLPHAGTLCILRIHPKDDPQWSREDGQEEIQEDGQEEEEGGKSSRQSQPASRPAWAGPQAGPPPDAAGLQAGPQAGPPPDAAGLQAGLGRLPGRTSTRRSRPPGRPSTRRSRPPGRTPTCVGRPPGRPRPAPRPVPHLSCLVLY